VQPDAPNGAASRLPRGGRDVLASKRHYCPHFLGGGIACWPRASARGLRGGGCWRSTATTIRCVRFLRTVADIKDGEIVLPEAPGLGIEPDVATIDKYGRFNPPARPACSHTARRSTGSRHEQPVALQAAKHRLAQRSGSAMRRSGRRRARYETAVEFWIAMPQPHHRLPSCRSACRPGPGRHRCGCACW